MASIAQANADKEAGTHRVGLALGAWGAAQAAAAGFAIAFGGILRDVVGHFAESGLFGDALANPATGYSVVYHLEVLLLFAALISLGPLLRRTRRPADRTSPASLSLLQAAP